MQNFGEKIYVLHEKQVKLHNYKKIVDKAQFVLVGLQD